jgi:hypothetical protein
MKSRSSRPEYNTKVTRQQTWLSVSDREPALSEANRRDSQVWPVVRLRGGKSKDRQAQFRTAGYVWTITRGATLACRFFHRCDHQSLDTPDHVGGVGVNPFHQQGVFVQLLDG